MIEGSVELSGCYLLCAISYRSDVTMGHRDSETTEVTVGHLGLTVTQ